MTTKWKLYRFLCAVPWAVFLIPFNTTASCFGIMLQISAFFAMTQEANRILKEMGSTFRV